MKRVLVTGSSGYLGSVLTDYLRRHEYSVVGYDTGFFLNSKLYPLSETDQTIFKDARSLTESDFKNIDAVVHLAGISNDPMGKLDAKRIYDPTREYALTIARICKKAGIKFIFASSCSIYGLGNETFLDETSEVSPQTPYSLNKLQIEQDLQSISDQNFSPIALRFATVFGSSPRIRFDVVVNMLTGMALADGNIVLNSDGKSWRPNLHILDVCKSVRYAIDYDKNDGKLLVLNVGSNENNLQVIDIAKTIQSVLPKCQLKFLNDDPSLDKEGLIRDRKVKAGGADTRTYKVSFDKIKKTFVGFKCDWTVKQGVVEMIENFNKVGFDKTMFKKRGFYRLQELEFLYENKYISEDLTWLKDRPKETL